MSNQGSVNDREALMCGEKKNLTGTRNIYYLNNHSGTEIEMEQLAQTHTDTHTHTKRNTECYSTESKTILSYTRVNHLDVCRNLAVF